MFPGSRIHLPFSLKIILKNIPRSLWGKRPWRFTPRKTSILKIVTEYNRKKMKLGTWGFKMSFQKSLSWTPQSAHITCIGRLLFLASFILIPRATYVGHFKLFSHNPQLYNKITWRGWLSDASVWQRNASVSSSTPGYKYWKKSGLLY